MLLRDLSVPLLDDERWRRGVCGLAVFGAPQLILARLGEPTAPALGDVPRFALVGAASLPLAFLAYTRMRDERPPSDGPLAFGLLALAFVSSCLWIDLLVNELVAGLEFVGLATGVSRSVLGLTVLAWGNGVGDLVANTALARSGNPKMGAAACFGGPLFNMLVGAGGALCAATLRSPSGVFCLARDATVPLTLAFLLGATLLTLLLAPALKFRLSARFGLLLVVYYAAFLAVALALELVGDPALTEWLSGWFGVGHGQCA